MFHLRTTIYRRMKLLMKNITLATIMLFSINTLAHVGVEPKSASAGGYTKLTFRVPHGCDGSATTKITVLLPENTLSVKPQVNHGWKIATKKVKLAKPITSHGKEITETISEVTWSGGVLPDEHMDEFGISLKLPETKEAKLAFPVIQTCKKGETKWADAADSAKPAPFISITEAEHKHH